jgi:hypothetical protein
MATKKKETESSAAPDKKNVVAGPAIVEKTVDKQAEEARGVEEAKEDNGGDASLRPKTFPNQDVLDHKDETKEARVQALKDLGIDPEAP